MKNSIEKYNKILDKKFNLINNKLNNYSLHLNIVVFLIFSMKFNSYNKGY